MKLGLLAIVALIAAALAVGRAIDRCPRSRAPEGCTWSCSAAKPGACPDCVQVCGQTALGVFGRY